MISKNDIIKKTLKKNTVKTHPLAEILSKKLFGIETVPAKEQRRAVNRAIKAAVEYHEKIINKIN